MLLYFDISYCGITFVYANVGMFFFYFLIFFSIILLFFNISKRGIKSKCKNSF